MNEEPIRIENDQYVDGVYHRHGEETDRVGPVPAGYYFVEGNKLIVAGPMETGGWSRSTKHSYAIKKGAAAKLSI